MLKKVYDYIKNNELCTINQIADDVEIRPIDALSVVNELHLRGFVKIVPIPLSETNDRSARYFASEKDFFDDSEFCVCKNLNSIASDTEASEFGYWDTCCICEKHIEDGFHYYNHYDGENHIDIEY